MKSIKVRKHKRKVHSKKSPMKIIWLPADKKKLETSYIDKELNWNAKKYLKKELKKYSTQKEKINFLKLEINDLKDQAQSYNNPSIFKRLYYKTREGGYGDQLLAAEELLHEFGVKTHRNPLFGRELKEYKKMVSERHAIFKAVQRQKMKKIKSAGIKLSNYIKDHHHHHSVSEFTYQGAKWKLDNNVDGPDIKIYKNDKLFMILEFGEDAEVYTPKHKRIGTILVSSDRDHTDREILSGFKKYLPLKVAKEAYRQFSDV